MTASPRQIHLGLFLQAAGHHVAGWRYPGAEFGSENLLHMQRIVATAERAKIRHGVPGRRTHQRRRRAPFDGRAVRAAVDVGCACHVNEPHRPRRHRLDHLWRAVPHRPRFRHVGPPEPGPRRLERGDDLLRAHRRELRHQPSAARRALRHRRGVHRRGEGLWDSWDDGAFPKDKATGVYADPSKLHVLDHKGKYFTVKGPLNSSRPPQGHPIIVQAGSSDTGQQLAARTAEVVFTAQQTLSTAQEFYKSLKSRLAAFGRTPESLAIMPGFLPVIGGTEKEARDKLATLEGWTDFSKALPLLSERLGHDISKYDLDGPLPELPESDQLQSRAKLLTDLARREGLTLRQLAQLRRHRPRSSRDVRHAGADRGADGRMVRRARLRRFQRNAAIFSRRPRRFRERRDPDSAEARALPDRL